MKNLIYKLLISLITIGLASVVAYDALTIEAATLTKNMEANEAIETSYITSQRFFKHQLPADAILDEKVLVGMSAKYDITAGLPIVQSLIVERQQTDEELKDGISEAVISIAVDGLRVPSDLSRGDVVNIVAYFNENILVDQGSFALGFNEKGRVENVRHDEAGMISSVDVAIEKSIVVELATAISIADVYIVRNVDSFEETLAGVTPSDLFLKYLNKNFTEVTEDVND